METCDLCGNPINARWKVCKNCANLAGNARELFDELVTLVSRCHELEKVFPEQAGMLRAMTLEARGAISKSVQTEMSGAD